MAQEEVKLPQLGESVTEAVIIAWLVQEGDEVQADQPLFEISTDKVDTEVPSPAAGVLVEIRAQVDDTIEVGEVVAVIDTEASAGSGEPEDEAGEEATTEAGEKDADAGDEAGEEPEEAQEPREPAAVRDAPAREPAAVRDAPAREQEPDASGAGNEHDYDVVILGAGTGGYSCALRAAQLGLRVVLVERDKVGGTCLHMGCIPTKALLQSAEIAEHAKDAHEFGVKVEFEGIEVAKVHEHKNTVVDRMYKGLQGALKTRGVETVKGTGRLVAPDTVEVETDEGSRTLRAPAVVVATGSAPREMPFAPFDGERIVSSDHALTLEEVPDRALVLGAGAIGLEFASVWHAFGSEVTVVELEDRLLPLEDPDVSKELAKQLRRKGIRSFTGAKMTAAEASGSGVTCTVETKDGTEQLEGDLLLVAVGRVAVTEATGIDEVGIELDRGFVKVDEYCRTSVEGVYALGDVIPTLMLAHASFAEGILVADQLGGLDALPIDYAGVPRVTYCHPEVASVGLSEPEAVERGHDVVIEKYAFQAIGRAQMMRATGLVKIVAEKGDGEEGAGRVLGIHLVGPRATDLISEAQLIYNWEALPIEVARLIHAHPSLGEAIGEAHLALAGRALHG